MELAVASLACTGVCAGCLVFLHLAPTGYSPLRDAVSRYGVGAYAPWYQAQAAFCGASAILLAFALRRPTQIVALLVVFGVARIAITQFPMDSKREAHWLLLQNTARHFVRMRPGERGAARRLLLVANRTRPLLHVHHTAIYQPRQAA